MNSSTKNSQAAIQGAKDAFTSLADFADDAKLSQLVAVQQSVCVLWLYALCTALLISFDRTALNT